ncbi:metal/formaldehyde-sensitive transcriptional repressor [Thalassococcus sp. S3]|uniref:metal/formaldehyde-sensitive transcriptional repressor n=1 Tax=Thalassococcus sp. S3 TaxID=2017482 RepID=UPI0010242B4E|nr:metal/formaldehyde-sensitive transcriptional repressor [Thalassococcus sp. S3]QBF34184.1 transcriptional regulator [Thalassococcus sp. S3]
MSHLSRDNSKLIARLRRIKGQVEGVERALEAEADCTEVLRQIASIRGAMNGLTNEVLQEHLHNHVVNAATDAARVQGAEEMIAILRSYLK